MRTCSERIGLAAALCGLMVATACATSRPVPQSNETAVPRTAPDSHRPSPHWPYSELLEDRIRNAADAARRPGGAAGPMMIGSKYSCAACHARM